MLYSARAASIVQAGLTGATGVFVLVAIACEV
jgi:hypothetical protein